MNVTVFVFLIKVVEDVLCLTSCTSLSHEVFNILSKIIRKQVQLHSYCLMKTKIRKLLSINQGGCLQHPTNVGLFTLSYV